MEGDMRTIRRRLLIAVMIAGAASTAAAQPARFSAPKDYLLALGDSLTFGFQQVKFNANPDPTNFDTGFVDDFARRLLATSSGQNAQVVNFGCPGETTSSFLTGPCAYHAVFGLPLHDDFVGSQMAAAEAFLAAHPGQVGPILVSIGPNDILEAVSACGGVDPQCIGALLPGILNTLGANYSQILARLRAAAPDTEIVILELYNPYAIFDAQTNVLTAAINQLIDGLASANRARAANPLPAFNLAPPQPATLCGLTFICSIGDIHPTDTGYQVIGDLMWAASGYARFEP
jgi:lysophospholipase L1-like esterase